MAFSVTDVPTSTYAGSNGSHNRDLSPTHQSANAIPSTVADIIQSVPSPTPVQVVHRPSGKPVTGKIIDTSPEAIKKMLEASNTQAAIPSEKQTYVAIALAIIGIALTAIGFTTKILPLCGIGLTLCAGALFIGPEKDS